MPSLTERIETLIAERGLNAGERLPPERVLAVELGVSRSRLREAIQQLVSRGVIISRQGGGNFVGEDASVLSLDRVLRPLQPLVRREAGYWRDVMEIRKSLETDAAYYAALRADADDKARLKAALTVIAGTGAADPSIQSRADTAFHLVVAEASHNVVLRQIVSGLADLLQESIAESLVKLYRLPNTVEALERQHDLIVEAILAGRAEDARKAAADHLAFVEDSLRFIEDETHRARRAALGKTTIQEKPRP